MAESYLIGQFINIRVSCTDFYKDVNLSGAADVFVNIETVEIEGLVLLILSMSCNHTIVLL